MEKAANQLVEETQEAHDEAINCSLELLHDKLEYFNVKADFFENTQRDNQQSGTGRYGIIEGGTGVDWKIFRKSRSEEESCQYLKKFEKSTESEEAQKKWWNLHQNKWILQLPLQDKTG